MAELRLSQSADLTLRCRSDHLEVPSYFLIVYFYSLFYALRIYMFNLPFHSPVRPGYGREVGSSDCLSYTLVACLAGD